MQEMIKRILEMDEQARQLTEDASSMRMQAEMTVEEKSQALKDEYLTRARKKVEQLEKRTGLCRGRMGANPRKRTPA